MADLSKLNHHVTTYAHLCKKCREEGVWNCNHDEPKMPLLKPEREFFFKHVIEYVIFLATSNMLYEVKNRDLEAQECYMIAKLMWEEIFHEDTKEICDFGIKFLETMMCMEYDVDITSAMAKDGSYQTTFSLKPRRMGDYKDMLQRKSPGLAPEIVKEYYAFTLQRLASYMDNKPLENGDRYKDIVKRTCESAKK
jgi:hypothetical protein